MQQKYNALRTAAEANALIDPSALEMGQVQFMQLQTHADNISRHLQAEKDEKTTLIK